MRLCCPAPIPIVENFFVITIALDLTYLQILKANSISLISFGVGFNLVTYFNFLLSNIILSFS